VDNLLYAYSPDVFGSREDYLRYYPGDAYVDVLGYDDYYSLARYDRLARIDTVAATAPETDAVVRWAGPDTLASGAAAPDSVGLDSVYVDPARADSLAAASLAGRLGVVVREARRRGKVAAFTETGYEGIPDSTWWTDRLLPALNADPQTRQIAWVLVWRNANRQRKPGHHYAPYPKHGSAADFRRFAASPLIFLQDEVPGLYD
jgi:mannan endo-1,4-beta-mannosidase